MNSKTHHTVDTDFYTRYWKIGEGKQTITFKLPEPSVYEKSEHDWQIIVALEKADKVKVDRHLLTRELLLEYRWAIREGFGHQLDPALRNQFDYPRNRNTIAGIRGYIDRIKKLSDEEMANINGEA